MRRLMGPLSSLRFRVPATAMIVFAVSLAVASVLAYELLLRDGQRDIDVVIDREHDRFERSITELLAEVHDDDPDIEPVQGLHDAVFRYLQLNPSTESYWTIVTFADGQRLAASNGPPELEPLFEARELPAGTLNVRETLETGTEAGDIRTATVPVMLGGEQAATLQIVSPLAPVRAEARDAAWSVAAAAGVALLLGGILLTSTLWRALKPLGTLADAARSIELRSLDARVPDPATRDEVGILADEFNTMLARLEHAAARQHEFMTSVGHELRTPITIARGHLELLETVSADDPDAIEETVGILREELGRMGRLVEDLMAIARADMNDFVHPRDLDLVSWFEELEMRLASTPAGVGVRIDPPPPVTVQADPDRLAQAVLNLVTNAYVHTPPGTPVRVRATLGEHDVAIVVEDQGPGIPESIRDDLFLPFVHGDTPSSTGLGLSVVRAVVSAHHGSVVVDSGERGTRIALRLPWDPTPDEVDLSPGAPHADDPDLDVPKDPRPTPAADGTDGRAEPPSGTVHDAPGPKEVDDAPAPRETGPAADQPTTFVDPSDIKPSATPTSTARIERGDGDARPTLRIHRSS